MPHLDTQTIREAAAGPGTDTRQWASVGVVMADQDGQRSVAFDAAGPLVMVKLMRGGQIVRCRVGMATGGAGEGEYHPFVAGDEVLVCVPDGDELGGCVITHRLSNEVDPFPTMVAGNDATQNNFAFKRVRAPYILEGASSLLFRSAHTGAFIAITEAGALNAANADKALLQLGADTLGFRNGDADCLVEVQVANRRTHVEAGGSKLQLSADGDSMLLSTGQLAISASGVQPVGHAVTVEQVLVLLQAFLTAVGAVNPGPLTGAGLAGLYVAQMNVALAAAGALPIAPLQAALLAALATPTSPAKPGVGSPGVTLG